MCGISGYYCWGDARPGPDLARMLLAENMVRGRDAAGFAYLDDGDEIAVVKNVGPASRLVEAVDKFSPEVWGKVAASPIVIAHTRAQTKGDARDNDNNHPVIFGSWIVVHNGMVLNDDDLFERQGAARFAEVDTAAIPLMLEGGGDKPFDELGLLGGSVSAALWSQASPRQLNLLRLNGADVYLFLVQSMDMLVFSSVGAVFRHLERIPLGSLRFTTTSTLPDNRLLALSPNRADSAVFIIDRKPFYKPRAVVPGFKASAPIDTGAAAAAVSDGWRYRVVFRDGNPELRNRVPPDLTRLGAEPSFEHFDRDKAYGVIANLESGEVVVPTTLGTWHLEAPGLESPGVRIVKYFRPRKAFKKMSNRRGWTQWWNLGATDEARTRLDGTMKFDFIDIKRETTTGTTSVIEPGYMCPHCGALAAVHTLRFDSGAAACRWCYIRSSMPSRIVG